MSYYTNELKGNIKLNEPALSESVGLNIQHYFEYNLISMGGFNNVAIMQSSYYSDDLSRLRPVQLGTGTDGKVWETPFSNLVWENNHVDIIPITGLYINNTFLSSNDFSINYPKGRITFSSSVPTTSIIQMNYSYKWTTFRVGESPLCTKLMDQSIEYETADIASTGIFNTLAENRLRMPCVFINDVSTQSTRGVQLGDASIYHYGNCFFYIYADNKWDRDKLAEIFINQTDRTIMMFNLAQAARSGVYPLMANGNINPSGLSYSDLINNYAWKRCRFVRCGKDPIQYEQRLFRGIIRNMLEVQIG